MGTFTINLRLGNIGYLQLSEENEDALKEKLDSLLNFRDAIVAKLETETSKMQNTVSVPLDIPSIEHPSSQYDAIVKVVQSDWARREPRGLNEIHSALATNAIHMDKTALGSRLTILTRQGKVRRIKRDGTFAYTAPIGDKSAIN